MPAASPARPRRKSRRSRTSSSRWCPTRRTSRRCCSVTTASRKAFHQGKTVVDMSSISPLATKEFARKIAALGCDYLDAPVSGGEVGAKAAPLTIMVGGSEAAVRQGQAAVRADGQEHHAGRRQRRRADDEGREPDHRRADDRGSRRGAALRGEGWRGSREGAAGADGRLRVVADPRSARRTHGEAHVQPGLSHRAAPEGPEPRARRPGAQLGVSLPNTATAQELFNACVANGFAALDHSALVRALERLANFEIGETPVARCVPTMAEPFKNPRATREPQLPTAGPQRAPR